MLHDVIRSGSPDRGNHRGFVIEPRHIAHTDGMARLKFEAEEILESSGEARLASRRRESAPDPLRRSEFVPGRADTSGTAA